VIVVSLNARPFFSAYKKSLGVKIMKKLQQLCAAAVLTLTLGLSTFAGDMGCPGVINPPPPQQSSVTGEMGTPGASAPGVSALDPVTGTALSLLQSILSLF
jgi:hypothetical protein